MPKINQDLQNYAEAIVTILDTNWNTTRLAKPLDGILLFHDVRRLGESILVYAKPTKAMPPITLGYGRFTEDAVVTIQLRTDNNEEGRTRLQALFNEVRRILLTKSRRGITAQPSGAHYNYLGPRLDLSNQTALYYRYDVDFHLMTFLSNIINTIEDADAGDSIGDPFVG